MPIVLTCEWCGELFEKRRDFAERYAHHFCNRACSSAFRKKRIEAACETCGQTFEFVASNRPGRFCSKACMEESRRVAPVVFACGWCAEPVERARADAERRNQRAFCSYEHWRLWADTRGNFESGTKIEYVVAAALDAASIAYEQQACVGGFYPDFLLIDAALIIEVDGDFYHANPALYPDHADLYEVQRRNRERDVRKNAAYLRRGYRVVRVWESEVMADARCVIERVRPLLR